MNIEDFKKWLNEWADISQHVSSIQFKEGYRTAVQDIYDKFEILILNLNADKNKKYKRWNEEENIKLIELYRLGYPISEISKELNRSHSTINSNIQWFKQNGTISEEIIKERRLEVKKQLNKDAEVLEDES